jgi:hypothetical protein
MKGMMDGWHGDENEVEFTCFSAYRGTRLTWDEWYDIECQKADLINDMVWIENNG